MPLYHATLATNVPSILANGLEPRVGSFVKDVYPRTKDTVVFAADDQTLRKVWRTMEFHISRLLNKSKPDVTATDFLEHGAVIVLPNEPFTYCASNSMRGKPRSVEAGDWWSTKPVPAQEALLGHDMFEMFFEKGEGWYVNRAYLVELSSLVRPHLPPTTLDGTADRDIEVALKRIFNIPHPGVSNDHTPDLISTTAHFHSGNRTHITEFAEQVATQIDNRKLRIQSVMQETTETLQPKR